MSLPNPPEKPSIFARPAFPALVGIVGVLSFSAAGFVIAQWLGLALLGVGCFLLVLLIRLCVWE